jgi:hypothetical protein
MHESFVVLPTKKVLLSYHGNILIVILQQKIIILCTLMQMSKSPWHVHLWFPNNSSSEVHQILCSWILCMIYFMLRWMLCSRFFALWHLSTWFCVVGFYKLQLFDMGFCVMWRILCMKVCVYFCVQLQGMT